METHGTWPALMRIMEPVATAIELFGVAVIVLSVFLATIAFLGEVRMVPVATAYQGYRANLGRGILLGLELLIGADHRHGDGPADLGERRTAGPDRSHPNVPQLLAGNRDRGPVALASDETRRRAALTARAADRAIAKVAPFHRQMNCIGGAIIVETYIDALAERQGDGVLAFITHNIRDFSQKGADTRLPHPDLNALFDGARSRYSTNLGALLKEYASELIEEITFDREYSQKLRVLSQLLETEDKLETQIRYGRK